MNELRGKYVNIVLMVEEGRGFDLVKCPLLVTANFNGRKMDSDIVEGASVVFSTEMVWETEKKFLRQARGSNGNIRLECLTSERKLIGFILLSLRSAKVIPASKATATHAQEMPNTWHRLQNIAAEFRKCGPELRVFLIIRDYVPNMPLRSPMHKTNTTPHLPKLQSLQMEQVQVPVKYAEEGFIQLGNPEDCTFKFQLKLTLLIGCDLDVLLPESMIFGDAPKSYHLSVEIFGLDVKTRKISENVYAPIVVFNEAIVINLQSTYSILRAYFKQFPETKVKFYAGSSFLAWTLIDMTKLNLDLCEIVFYQHDQRKLEFEQTCFFEGHYRATTSAEVMRRATVSTQCKLAAVEYFGDKHMGHSDKDGISPLSPMSPAGDYLSAAPVQISLSGDNDDDEDEDYSTVSSSTVDSDDLRDNMDQHQQFLLELSVESIVWKIKHPATKVLLKFVHPLGKSYISTELKVEIEPDAEDLVDGAVCSLCLISLKSRFNFMMTNYMPSVELYDVETNADIGRVLTPNIARFNIKRPGPPSKNALVSPSGEEIGTVNISFMAMEMREVIAGEPTLYHLSPCILDESIIIHSLSELDEMLIKVRLEFEEQLAIEKTQEIRLLRDEWRMKTCPLQEDLRKNLEKCRTLVERQGKRKQMEFIDEEVESRASSQEYCLILEIHKNTIKYSLADRQALIEHISEVEVKNAILREMLSEQSTHMQEVKETQLTAEQTKVLLKDLKAMEEKFEIAQQDKNYFKKEYEKAMKEVHNLKVDYHKNIASKIALDKKALNTYCPILSNDTIAELPMIDISDITADHGIDTGRTDEA